MEPHEILFAVVGYLATLILSVFSAFLAARLTVQSSLRQFGAQKRWEHKHKAYSDLVNEIYRLIEITGSDDEPDEKDLETFTSSLDSLRKHAAIGKLVLSDASADRISKYFISIFEKSEGGQKVRTEEYQELVYRELVLLVEDLVKLAKKDLEETERVASN